MSIHTNAFGHFLIHKLFLAVILTANIGLAVGQNTNFTYQGRLTDGGTAANGTYDLQFKLCDMGGNPLGQPAVRSGVIVTDGVFTVQLNFPTFFNGADRLLEIGVRPSGSQDAYTILLPRQAINPTPYAIRSFETSNADNALKLNGKPATEYVLTDDPRLTGGSPGGLQGTVINATSQYNLMGQRFIYILDTNNTSIGIDAGKELLDSSINNTFVGKGAGSKTLIGINNTFVGTEAGTNNRGTVNTFVGAFSGRDSNGGSRNTFVGSSAGASSVGTSEGTYVGFAAGADGNGEQNSFFGVRSGLKTTGSENAFFGGESGQSNTTGSNNSFFGFESGLLNKTANANAFFGSYTGRLNTTGGANSFFGHNAGKSNTTANENAYFGTDSGTLSTGANNAFFGSKSGTNNTTGFANAFFGMSAGLQNQGGFNNAFFGRGAGQTNLGGSSNTIIGALADVSSGGLSFATAIGANATVGTSNTIVLGRSNGSDAVQVPGTLAVSSLGTIGVTSVCRNALNQLATCSSSLRYKTDIAPFTPGLTLLNKLNPITFNWRSNNSADLGFGAEDIAAVEPLLVIKNEQGQVEGVKYDRITAVLVNAIKEQQQQINALKKLVCSQNRRAAACKK